jgi:hypothetical protein
VEVDMLKSQRTGGPKTEAGKKAVSLNALKSGVYAKMVVLPNESERDFMELHAQLLKDYAAQGAVETNLVLQLTIQMWKKARLDRLEHATMMRLMHKPLSDVDIINGGFKVGTKCAWLLNDLAQMKPIFIDDSHFFLVRYFELQTVNPIVLDFNYISKWLPSHYEMALVKAAVLLKLPKDKISLEMLNSLNIPDPDNIENIILLKDYLLKYLSQKSWQVIDVAECLDDCKRKVAEIKDRRIFNFMSDSIAKHAQSDLSREFYKTMNELRRQQQWRMNIKTIEVLPIEMPSNHKLN